MGRKLKQEKIKEKRKERRKKTRKSNTIIMRKVYKGKDRKQWKRK